MAAAADVEEEEEEEPWDAREERRQKCAEDVVRAMLYGGSGGGGGGSGKNHLDEAAVESRLLRLPLPDAKVPRSLLNLAASSVSSSTPSNALRAALSPRKLRVPDVDGALCERCELTPGDR